MKKLRIPHLKLLPVITLAFLILKLVDSSQITFRSIFSFVYSCLAYFIWGAVTAYLINPLLVFFDKLISSKKDTDKIKKAKRILNIGFLYTSFICLLSLSAVAIVPSVSDIIRQISDKIPSMVIFVRENFSKIAENKTALPLGYMLEKALVFLYDYLKAFDISAIYEKLSGMLGGSITSVSRLIFGFFISVYFLYSKETILLETKKLLDAFFSEEKQEKISKTAKSINEIFSDFLGGKVIESAAVFVLTAIVFRWLSVPFFLPLSLICAVTNLIPYFGPFLGGGICALLTLLFSPEKTFFVILASVLIQLVDNFIISPKIISDHVGINPLLVIFGVTVGGQLFGLFGMFFGVPLIAAIKKVVYDNMITKKNQKI